MRVFLRRDFFFFDSTSFSFSRLLAFETSLTVEIVIAIKPNSVYSLKLQQNTIYTTSRRAKSVRLKNRFFSEEIRRDSSICPRNRTHTGGRGCRTPNEFFCERDYKFDRTSTAVLPSQSNISNGRHHVRNRCDWSRSILRDGPSEVQTGEEISGRNVNDVPGVLDDSLHHFVSKRRTNITRDGRASGNHNNQYERSLYTSRRV